MNKKLDIAPCLAVMGTGSDVGKSVIADRPVPHFWQTGVAGGALQGPEHVQQFRGNRRRGWRWAGPRSSRPRLPGIAPHVDMNPILLKPTSDVGSQVVLLGQSIGNQTAMDYHQKESPSGADRQRRPGPPAIRITTWW